MLLLRSLLFNIAFYLNVILWMVVFLPTFVLPRRFFMQVARGWALSNLWLLKVLAGVGYELRGKENLPKGGCIIACKHQSVWETFALFTVLDDPVYILKRELRWIPLFGWYTAKSQMIAVNRSGGASALAEMNAKAVKAAREGRQLIIFPEGTRRAPHDPPRYKQGVSHLYQTLGMPLVPVALNSGLFWPRRKFLRKPGTIVIEILPPLAPGLVRQDVMRRMQDAIETASTRLRDEGEAELAARGLRAFAVQR